ncbi:WAS/WASL-interacting protein family member 1 [Bifidobacterium tissieri]|uniref:WAS/WASL-interacting protein family member 1 n=1 Tax=Bifidobacterium tissieri TaxID=1630162 RepID=A0A261FG95_9BIFI|nr:phage holin family protein [Bifidobacterium tissieri]OZG58098.1 WAS/WASL-interacting protein family member 1 [Bifidobacterium tissieri]
MTTIDPQNDQKTTVMPVGGNGTADGNATVNGTGTVGDSASEAPTQTLDPDRIKAQNAPTETMPPVGATPIASTTDGNGDTADTLPTQPIVGKPDVTLAGTEYEQPGPFSPETTPSSVSEEPLPAAEGPATAPAAPASPTPFPTPAPMPNPTPTPAPSPEQAWSASPEQPMNPQQAAWSQQQAAAQGYANEAQRNNYPGSGNTAQATAGPQYQNYPGWNQYAPNIGQQYPPRIEYRKGPSTPTIIWGALIALFALGGLGGSWLFGFSMSLSMWTIFAIVALVVMGVTLVIGGVAAAMRRRNGNGRTPKTRAPGATGAPKA